LLTPHVRAVTFAIIAVLVFSVVLFSPTDVQAQIYVDAGATGAGNGSSWANAYTDLQSALDVATGTDQIWIAEGTYTPSAQLDAGDARTATFLITGNQDGIEIYGGFESGDAFDDRSPTDHPVVFSGDLNGDDGPDTDGDGIPDSGRDENAYHVVVFNGGAAVGAEVTANVTHATLLDGIIVTGGNAITTSFPDFAGGGVYCDGAGTGNACNPTFSSMTFTSNSARYGGAVYNDGQSSGESSPHITGSTFTNNTAVLDGGAIYNHGYSGESNPQITNSTFTSNSASGGGAIYNDGRLTGTSSPQITSTNFTSNTAGGGGAIYNDGSFLGGESSPHINRSTFTDNTASSDGGAIANLGFDGGTSNPRITGSIFVSNTASSGGAIANDGTDGVSSPRIITSTFIANTVEFRGGAISNVGSRGESSPTITGSTFSSNSALGNPSFATSGLGGAIFSVGGDVGVSSPQVTNSTFSGNSAVDGGAMYNDGAFGDSNPQTTNVIFWNNSAANLGNQIYNDAAMSMLAHTLLEGGLSGISENNGSSTIDGGNNIDADPLFANASDPDGPDDIPATDDDGLRLLPGSPALDAGDNGALPPDIADLDGDGNTAEPIPFDIAGSDRIRDNNPDTPPTVDLGAYEAPGDVAIPVELVSLTATSVGGQDIMLTWQTASETNNAGFTVEQRVLDPDGTSARGPASSGAAWRDIAFVQGMGTTAEAQTYRYRMTGIRYGRHAFRLRQVDLDGTETLTSAVEIDVMIAEAYALAAYPNPVTAGQSATINVTAREAQRVTIAIYDLLGRRVTTLFDGEIAANRVKTLKLPMSVLAGGMYFVQVVGERFTATERITVVR